MAEMKASSAVPLSTLADVNDLGKPWRWEEDGMTVTRTAPWSPPGCHPVACGLKLYTDKDGKLVKVEGDENQPITQGRLCVRCLTLKDYIYNPSRIIHPMKRAREDRGNPDAWEQCTWEEALDIIEENYKRITEEYGRESIVCFAGTGREGGTLAAWGSAALCTPNFCYSQSGYACYCPRLAASAYTLGCPYPEIDYAGGLAGRYDDPAFEVPEVLMIWGKDPLASNPDGFFGHAVVDMMRRGTRLIVVDPRATWLATHADIHVRLRPGTDAAFGMAMINTIIEEDLYDHDFVEYWCYGFEALAERVKDMPAEKAADIIGVPAETIKAAARMYAAGTPSALQWGLAFDQKANGMQCGHCAIALMSITGNVDVPGGQVLPPANSGLNEAGFLMKKGLGAELMAKTIGLKEYPAYVNTILNSHADLTLRAMETGDPYPIKMGFYAGNNLMSCTSAEPRRWHDAIVNNLDFCFTLETFMTPSAQASCEVFLPLSTAAEEDGVDFTHYGGTPVGTGFMNKALQVGECKTDMEACMAVGKRLNPSVWDEYDDVYDFIDHLRLKKRNKFKDVHEEVFVQTGVEYYKNEIGKLRSDGQPGFNTPTGRIELYSTIFEQFGDDPLPYYLEPQYSPKSTPELLKDYPLVLTTGARTYAFFHSENRQIPYCRELNPDPLIEINPETARAYGISNGQWVEVWNQFGSAKLKAKISQIVDENTVHAQHGWWFPEESGNEPDPYGTFRSNINNLVPNFHFGKLGFGAPFKCLLCNIKPLKESYDTDMKRVWEMFKREDQ